MDEDEEDGGYDEKKEPVTMEKSNNNNNTNDNINLTFASLHALSAWLSVKSIVKTTTVILEKTTTQLVVPGGDGAGKSMFSLAHAAMCLLNMLRSSVKTYREIRNTNIVKSRRKKKNKKRNGFGGFKKKEKLRFLRNTQTSANDAKSALERANEALFTADAVLDTDDFDLDYDEEETNRMNLKSLGALALSGVFGHVNDEFKDGRYPTAKERQLMRRFVDAVTSASFGAALRVTAGMAWSLDDKIGRNHRAIETVFVASRAMEKEKRKEASKGLGLEGLTTRFRSNDVNNSNNGSNSSSRKEGSKSRNTSRGESSSSSASPFNRWRKNGGGRNETKKKPPVVNSSLSKATKQKMKIVDKKDFKRPAVVNPKDTFGTRRLLFPSSSSSTKTNNNTTKAKRISSRAAKTTTTKENNNNNKNQNRATGVKKINRKDAKRAQDDCTWFERARERLPRVAPVILILAGFVL